MNLQDEMTITRALAELKLLDSRIEKKITESDFVYFVSKKNKNQVSNEVLTSNAKSHYQSITDLIERRKKIKSAIIVSNASTRVNLNGVEMSVAEVIEMKQLLPFYKSLLQKMKHNREYVVNQVERSNQQMENELQRLLEVSFGKQTTMKTNADDIENISKTYRDNNRSEILDTINIDNKIKDLEDTINSLETESNFILSESNALTKIKV